MKDSFQIGLGGGCHWCTEAVMQVVPGVIQVTQGYVASVFPFDTLSEAVLVNFNRNIDLELLLDVHLETHVSTVLHSRSAIYRSAIYCMFESQIEEVKLIISSLSRKRNKNYITAILPLVEFKASRESLQGYYKTRPQSPFCKQYIEPKLELTKKLIHKFHL
jgi:peptide-methionine (S)-S-oxide reductase